MNKEELSLIVRLQEIDSEIFRKNAEIESIPKQILRYKSPLSAAEKSLKKIEDEFDSLEKKRREKDLELKEITDRIEKLKSRVSEIKTNKEYKAHLAEIEKTEKKKYLIEDDILYLMEEAEEKTRTLEEARKTIEEQKQKLQSIQKELDMKSEEARKELSALREKRASIVKRIPEEFYVRYMDVLEKSNGLAVVEARDEVCLGCHMSIPPQLYLIIKDSDELIQCPQCNRFLFRKD
jgi:predicted  nucleic acid-binding Zn-ribbon protein